MDFKNWKTAVSPNTVYLGDPSTADWVASGEPKQYDTSQAMLTMAQGSFGTVLSSTVYMWYGNVKARLKTSRGKGVVTAFILFSDVQDEIDYEWVGVNLEQSQTNYYSLGNPTYTNGGNSTMTNSYDNFHDYEINWTPDKIDWIIDGNVTRTKKRSDTYNSTSHSWDFPQTPSRVQFSLWPAGDPKNPPGTVNWAGGNIDWNSPEMETDYYFAIVDSVEIKCYNAKTAPGTNKNKSYTYSSTLGTNDTVIDGNSDTVLGSFLATGKDMKQGKGQSTDGAQTVPGGGSPGQDHSGTTPSSSSSGTNGDVATCNPRDWNQKCGSSQAASGTGKSAPNKAGASVAALVLAGVFALCL